MRRGLALCAVAVVALVCTTAATAAAPKGPTAAQFAALQRQVASLSATVTQLKSQVQTNQTDIATVAANLVCHVALIGTFDYSVVDLFADIAGQPAPFVGQVVPDNGACAAIGLTPPTPAADRYSPNTLSASLASNIALARILGVQPK